MGGARSVLYVGCYTAPHTAPGGVAPSRAEGIGVLALDGVSGALAPIGVAGGIPNPSWLTLHPTRPFLYAVAETDTWQDRPGTGGVAAFAIGPDGRLTMLGTQASAGEGPAGACVDEAGCHLMVAGYASGTVAVLAIHHDGSLGPATHVTYLHGQGPDAQRQASPHPHDVVMVGDAVLVPDLGTDTVRRYALDHDHGTLVPRPDAGYSRPGGGARHVAASTDGRSLYLVEEIGNALLVLDLHPDRPGALRQALPTVPDAHLGKSLASEVLVHPAGYVYVTNRGFDDIARFRVAPDGELHPLGWTPSGTAFVRHATLAAGSTLLLAAGQNGDSIVAFHVDVATGDLVPTGAVAESPTPVCLVEWPNEG
jgi:6-phosphogluconolactonase